MKTIVNKVLSVFISLTLLFCLTGCLAAKTVIEIEDGTVNIKSGGTVPKLTLIGDEERAIENNEFFHQLVETIDGKPIDDAPVERDDICNCDLKYTVRMVTSLTGGYYLTLHTHGIEISEYCKYRKCLDLLGIAEVEETAMGVLIEMLEEA